MSQPSRPAFLKEGPATACVLHGQILGWKACTCLATGMGIDKTTLGRIRLSGCAIRSATGDYFGGTTLGQMQDVATAHGVVTEMHVGGNIVTLAYAAIQCARGRGFEMQGNCLPDGRGNINHAIWVNETRGDVFAKTAEFLVYDPWSSGPAWWSWQKLNAFGRALHPWGESDPRTLRSEGIDGIYCLIFPDTEPHVHAHYGGVKTTPFPDVLTIHSPAKGRRVNVRSRPDRIAAGDVVGTLPSGGKWTAYQVDKNGVKPAGSTSRVWYGNHDGNRWIHSSGVVGVGGAS